MKTLAFMLSVMIAGCANSRATPKAEEMHIRASALTKLSTAMEGFVRYGSANSSMSEEQLISAGTKHDVALVKNLDGYKIRVLSRDRHAIVLVCTKPGNRALLEDAGCTARLDRHHWQKQGIPCDFTLSATTVCAQK